MSSGSMKLGTVVLELLRQLAQIRLGALAGREVSTSRWPASSSLRAIACTRRRACPPRQPPGRWCPRGAPAPRPPLLHRRGPTRARRLDPGGRHRVLVGSSGREFPGDPREARTDPRRLAGPIAGRTKDAAIAMDGSREPPRDFLDGMPWAARSWSPAWAAPTATIRRMAPAPSSRPRPRPASPGGGDRGGAPAPWPTTRPAG